MGVEGVAEVGVVAGYCLDRLFLRAHRRQEVLSGGCSISEQLLHRNGQRFRGGLVFKAHRLLYHSSLGVRVKKKK